MNGATKPGSNATKIAGFRCSYWAEQALLSQSACNASGLLNSALKCLHEWRDAGGDNNGKECIPFRFIIHHVSFLCGVNPSGLTYGRKDDDDYCSHDKLLREWSKQEPEKAAGT